MEPQRFGSPVSPPGLPVPNNSPSSSFQCGEQLQSHLLSGALEANSMSYQQGCNDTFVRAQPVAGTLRRPAGLPSLRPNKPRNDSRSHLGEMKKAFSHNQSQNFNQSNRSSFQNTGGQQPNHGQQQDFGTQRAYGQHFDAHDQTNYVAQNGYNLDSTSADEHAYLQNRLYCLAQTISAQPGLSVHVVALWTSDLFNLSQRHVALRRNLQTEHRLVEAERVRLEQLITSQQQLIQNALAERDRACLERDRLQAQFSVVRGRQRDLEQRLEDVERKNVSIIESLRKQLRFKEEQLNGKRSLWMEKQSHRASVSNHNLDSRDPFATPTAHHVRRTGMGLATTENLDRLPVTPGPPYLSQFLRNFPSENLVPDPRNEFWPYFTENFDHPAAQVETGHSPIGKSNALIPFKTEDQIALEFREEFDAIYSLVEDWANRFAHELNDDPSQDQELSHDDELWPFLLSCTYENYGDAHGHVINLLRNPATRASFVVRVIIQYLHLFIWKATAFGDFNPKYLEKLRLIEAHLKVKGLEPAQRANLVAAQTHAIQCIVESKTYLAFRSVALSGHTRCLRGYLGPLLNANAIRSDAGKTLGDIAVSAWDLSARLYTSNYTFLFNFPPSGGKFIHPTMESVDPRIEETDLQLHIRQARIKLTIKPIITMRNDRHMTITAKRIENGHVLILP